MLFKNGLTVSAGRDSIRTAPPPKAMKSTRSKRRKRKQSIIGSIRRPLAPPGHPLAEAKPDPKARPAGRKAKHKQRPEKLELEDEY
jgi:hypothetical protein